MNLVGEFYSCQTLSLGAWTDLPKKNLQTSESRTLIEQNSISVRKLKLTSTYFLNGKKSGKLKINLRGLLTEDLLTTSLIAVDRSALRALRGLYHCKCKMWPGPQQGMVWARKPDAERECVWKRGSVSERERKRESKRGEIRGERGQTDTQQYTEIQGD